MSGSRGAVMFVLVLEAVNNVMMSEAQVEVFAGFHSGLLNP